MAATLSTLKLGVPGRGAGGARFNRAQQLQGAWRADPAGPDRQVLNLFQSLQPNLADRRMWQTGVCSTNNLNAGQ